MGAPILQAQLSIDGSRDGGEGRRRRWYVFFFFFPPRVVLFATGHGCIVLREIVGD